MQLKQLNVLMFDDLAIEQGFFLGNVLFVVLYYSSAEGKMAGNLLLFKVEPRDSPKRNKCLRIHVYSVQRQREMATGKKVEGGKESISSTPCSPQMNLSCSVIFSLSLFFFPFPYSPAPSYIYCS